MKSVFSIAAVGVVAAAILAACSGGGHTTPMPAATSVVSAQAGAITVMIGGPGTQAARRNGQTIPAVNSKSLVMAYIGDSNPTAAPTNPFAMPSSVTPVSFSGVNYINLSTATNCNSIGSGSTATLACTISGFTLPVGTIDLYIIIYDQTGGTGNMIYGTVSPVAVATTGVLTNPNTQSALTSFSLGGNYALSGTTIGFSNGSLSLTPNAAAVAISSPYPISGQFTVYAADSNGIKASGALSPITVSINDTTASACLAYAATSTSNPTPVPTACTFATIGSTPQPVTATNTLDQMYVQYNNRPASLAGGVGPWVVTAAAASPQASATAASTSIPVLLQPAAFVASPSLPSGSSGYQGDLAVSAGIIYAASSTSGLAPISAISALTMSNGLLSSSTTLPSTLTTSVNALITSTSGSTPAPVPTTASTLQGTVAAMTQGPDNNLWFAENTSTGIAIGVYVPPSSGTAISGVVAKGGVAESVNIPAESGTTSGITSGATVTGMTSFSGYVWVTDNKGDLMRVSTTNFGTTIGNDTLATGIVVLLGGTTTTSSTLAPSNGVGLAADAAPSPLPGLTSNGTALVYPGGTGSVVGVTVNSGATAAGGSFLTGTASTDLKIAAPGTFSQTGGGVVFATDSNIWTNSTTAFLNTNLTKTASVSFAGALSNATGGGIAQSALDKFIFTILSGSNALTYTSTDGSITSNVPLGSGTSSCTGLSPVASGGEGLITVSNYFIWASSTKFCIVIE